MEKPYEAPFAPCLCPVCRGILDHAFNLADEQPVVEGDYALCQHCGSFLVIAKDFTFTEVDEALIRTDKRFSPRSIEDLFEAQRAVRARAKLVVTTGPNGRVVQMIPRDPPARGEN